MDGRGIVRGQRVNERMRWLAKEMRREMTPAECLLWQELRAGRLAGLRFRRQQVIDGYIVDFYCDRAGLVIEVDGPIHDTRADADAERDDWLLGRGLRVLHVRNDDVLHRLDAVLDRIVKAAASTDTPSAPPQQSPSP